MPNFNKVILVGHLTRDPDVKTVGADKMVAKCGLAINEGYGDNKRTVFVDFEAWGKAAEFMGNYLTKGSAVLLEGGLKLDSWEDKETGAKRSKLYVNAYKVESLGGGEGKKAEGGGSRLQQPARTPPPAAVEPDDEPPF